jgi:hypothetical protein
MAIGIRPASFALVKTNAIKNAVRLSEGALDWLRTFLKHVVLKAKIGVLAKIWYGSVMDAVDASQILAMAGEIPTTK